MQKQQENESEFPEQEAGFATQSWYWRPAREAELPEMFLGPWGKVGPLLLIFLTNQLQLWALQSWGAKGNLSTIHACDCQCDTRVHGIPAPSSHTMRGPETLREDNLSQLGETR